MKNIKKLLIIYVFLGLLFIRPSSSSLLDLLKAGSYFLVFRIDLSFILGELNQYLGFNKNLLTCSNILRYKLFIEPNWWKLINFSL